MIKKKDLFNLINDEDPDIICLCETKTSSPVDQSHIDEHLNNKYYQYWNASITKKGYSGTCILTKKKPKTVIYGIDDFDQEGRVITCEFTKFYLVNVYTPNSGEELKRLKYRITEWDVKFLEFIMKLQEKKSVILCGDLNVAHKEIDLKNPKTNLRSAGFTIEERESFTNLLNKTNMIDTFRYFNPDTIKYSYWSYRMASRSRNTGWRLDYFICSEKLIKKIIKSDILTDILGSDHAPIILEII
jgi:exodeoxyribonuclease-3